MGSVTQLYHFEDVHIDDERLSFLAADQGDMAISRVLEDIAVRLARIENAYKRNAIRKVREGTAALGDLSRDAGMVSLHMTTQNVVALSQSDDTAAFGAALARMIRVGEMSLVTVWDVKGMYV